MSDREIWEVRMYFWILLAAVASYEPTSWLHRVPAFVAGVCFYQMVRAWRDEEEDTVV